MLDKKELEKKLGDLTYELVFKVGSYKEGFEKLKKFVWDYANECWTDGNNFGSEHGSDD